MCDAAKSTRRVEILTRRVEISKRRVDFCTKKAPFIDKTMANNPSIADIVQVLERRVRQELNDRLPRRVGVMAVNHFNQNFRDSGWRDNGLHPWLRVRTHVPYIIYILRVHSTLPYSLY